MGPLPLGWMTDVAVLELMGSTVDDRGDHLVVRSPGNPQFHWGNCILVTDPGAVEDAAGWLAAFRAAIPDADWIAIGLVRMPAHDSAWAKLGLGPEFVDVLSTSTLPRRSEPPQGCTVRALGGDDWERLVDRQLVENAANGQYEPASHELFLRARVAQQRDLCARGMAMFVGAFVGSRLVGELGVVRCGATARYQDVGTDAAFRRRGIASHLLGVAALWAFDQGCRQWVILTEAVNPAGRVYRRAGFAPDVRLVTVYRAPPVLDEPT